MQIEGDWYVEHYGDKFEVHEGDTYIKEIGETYIEKTGNIVQTQIGNFGWSIDGEFSHMITQNAYQKIDLNCTQIIGNDSFLNIGRNLIHRVDGKADYFIGKGKSIKIIGNRYEEIFGNETKLITENFTETIRNNASVEVGNDITVISHKGNIDVKTLGEFEICDDPKAMAITMTGPGYANIGTKGNIKITSTFGNIGINTVKNDGLFKFDRKYVCMAWNPGYLNNIAAAQAARVPINKDIILTDLSLTLNPIDIFNQLMGTLLLYDGFPTYLPCRMIMQNPNVVPSGTWWEDFRSIDDDWTDITNKRYWKLISKVMGNIDIKSWNGDINIETEGTLGNGGNIRLTANNKNGALPGYECGNILMKANTDFNIYTDPRDVFFDSDFEQKLKGKFVLFSHNEDIVKTGSTPTILQTGGIVSIIGKTLLDILKPAVGLSQFDLGFAGQTTLAGSCPKCIYDVLKQTGLSLGMFSPLEYEQLQLWLNDGDEGWGKHKFNSFTPSYLDMINGKTGGSITFPILFGEKGISNGFGHANDIYGVNENFMSTTPSARFGNVLINGVGSYGLNMGKNVLLSGGANNFLFGAKTDAKTDWITPYQIQSTKFAEYPVIGDVNRYLFSKFDGHDIGTYHASFNSNDKSGLYTQGEKGLIGNDNTKYTINLPGLRFEQQLSEIQLSEIFKPSFSENYTLNNFNWNLGEKIDYKLNDGISTLLKIGNSYFGGTISGSVGITSIAGEHQLPNVWASTAGIIQPDESIVDPLNIISTITGTLFNFIPGLGINGYNILQAISGGEISLPASNDLFIDIPNVARFYNENLYSIGIPYHTTISGGLISTPSSAKPIVYGIGKYGLPPLGELVDIPGSVGNPFTALQGFFNAFKSFENIELYHNFGLSMPYNGTDLAKSSVNLIGNDVITGELGLVTGGKFLATINLLNSGPNQEHEKIFAYSHLDIGSLFEGNLIINSNNYLLTNGLDIYAGLTPFNIGSFFDPNSPINLHVKATVLEIIKDRPAIEVYGAFPPAASVSIIGNREESDEAGFFVGVDWGGKIIPSNAKGELTLLGNVDALHIEAGPKKLVLNIFGLEFINYPDGVAKVIGNVLKSGILDLIS